MPLTQKDAKLSTPQQAQMGELQPTRLLKTGRVSAEYGVPIASLETMRVRGGGPKFLRCGRAIYYDRGDIEAWIESNKYETTSDARDE